MRTLKIAAAVTLLAGLALHPAAASAGASTAAVEKSDNVKHLGRVPFWGGTHFAFDGNFAYAGQWNGRGARPEEGGVRIIGLKGKPRQLGFFACSGDDVDVEVVRKGLIAVGHHRADCNPPDAGEANAGIYLLDVRNPRKPKMVGSINLPSGRQTHTISVYPGKPIVYSNAGGLPTNGNRFAVMIDVSNPRKPEVVGEYQNPSPPTGCHDLTFHFDDRGKFGICAGYQGTQIWDVSDPLAPEVVTTIYNPLIQFHHFAQANRSGTLLAINDEAIGANGCFDRRVPAGAVWFYDISDIESPRLASYYAPPRGNTGSPVGSFWTPGGTCTSHDFGWAKDDKIVVPWFTGGINILNLEDPSSPEEIAHYQAEDSDVWSGAYYRGRVYINDTERGFEALKVKGL